MGIGVLPGTAINKLPGYKFSQAFGHAVNVSLTLLLSARNI